MSSAATPLVQPRATAGIAARDPATPRLVWLARWLPVAGWLLLAVLMLVPAMGGSRYLLYLGTLIALQAALATSLNLVMGYAGQFAMSHAAFYGFGAYASALLVGSAGLSFWIVGSGDDAARGGAGRAASAIRRCATPAACISR